MNTSATCHQGSSPLTRGKRGGRRKGRNVRGLIPAHAGKTASPRRGDRPRAAHPRSRGENCLGRWGLLYLLGSSPLTRGKPADRRACALRIGLIPAHAGKTPHKRPRRLSQGAHPRSRGENVGAPCFGSQHEGSSPLTRGKPGIVTVRLARLGLIPAHAGKTAPFRRVYWSMEAHPRSRGENARSAATMPYRAGSSPLTRGKHFLTCAFIAQIGQILESLELCASSESYSSPEAYATDAPQDRVRSIGLAPLSSRGAS